MAITAPPAKAAPKPATDDTPTGTEAEKRIRELVAENKKLKAAAEDYPAMQAKLARVERDRAFERFAYQNELSDDALDPEVIDDIGRRYDREVAAKGDKAPEFGAFLTTLAEKPPVTLRTAFTKREPAKVETVDEEGVVVPAVRATPGDVTNGVVPRNGVAPATKWGDKEVSGASPAQVRANLKDIEDAARRDGLIR